MRTRERKRRRRSLWGWIKWAPALGVVFPVLFLDVWLNIETRRNDYAFHDLNASIREAQKAIKDLKRDRAGLEQLDELAMAAPDLGLAEPEPDQIHTLVFAAATDLSGAETFYYPDQHTPEPAPKRLDEKIESIFGEVAQLQTKSQGFVSWLRAQLPGHDAATSPGEPSTEDPSPSTAPETVAATLQPASANGENLDQSLPDLLGHF